MEATSDDEGPSVWHIFLIHWQHDEIAAFSEPLRDAGWRVDTEHESVDEAVRRAGALQPHVVVLSLRRDPERGRQVAKGLAADDTTRDLTVVVVDGDDDDVTTVREHLPGAIAVDWTELPARLRALLEPGSA